MTKPKHTPGPWRFHPPVRYSSASVEAYDQPGSNVDIAVCGTRYLSDAENSANAVLIAAAPEMLEALKYIEATVSKLDAEMRDGFGWPQLNRVRAAIAKAEGRP